MRRPFGGLKRAPPSIFIILPLTLAIFLLAANGQNFYNHKQQQQQRHQHSMAEFLVQGLGQGLGQSRNLTLGRHLNPIIIRNDIVIKRDAKLTIEAGVELYFAPRRGIIVQGVLEILGQPNEKVRLQLLRGVSQQHAGQSAFKQSLVTRSRPQVRLVDGDLPNEGRVQIKLNNRWHSLCTQSKNLTANDISVLCRQAGYQPGHWYRWFPGRHNSTLSTMSPAAGAQFVAQASVRSFQCAGNESQLQLCPHWNRLRVGGGVCDNQFDLGIRCSRKLAPDLSGANVTYWRGIEFQEAESQQEYILEGQMKRRTSKSVLQHLVITEAGLDEAQNGTAAIRVYGQPPRMSHVQISHSMYGVWVHNVQDAIQMNDLKLVNNMNAPLFINSSHGKVQLDRLEVAHNGGDGIRLVRHERPLVGSHDFCKFANLGVDQTYPVVLSHEQQFLRTGRDCCQEFISQQQQLTVHFPVLRSTPNNLLPETGNSAALNEANMNAAVAAAAAAASGHNLSPSQLPGRQLVSVPAGVRLGRDAQLIIYDDYREDSPFKLTIRNETRAQSIVSKAGRLKICYEPASFRTVLFTIEVVADMIKGGQRDYEQNTGIAHDLELSDSLLDNNEGRGLWLDNMRSGLLLFNTTISNHQHLAGLHAENGTGEVIVSASRLVNNTGHGIYIQQAGGYYHVDNSTLSDNSARGISIEHDRRPELVAFNHTFHLGYSLVSRNGQQGLYLGNVCRSDAFWNVSMNTFSGNLDDAIHFESCRASHQNVQNFHLLTSRVSSPTSPPSDLTNHSNTKLQELHITHNVFLENQRRAVRLAPVHFVRAFVRHNLFRGHPLAVLLISNQHNNAAPGGGGGGDDGQANFDQDDANFNSSHLAPANIRVAWNRFYANRGRYVANLGLDEEGLRQQLVFTKNQLERNAIVEPYGDLKPRSRCSAVVVVGSSQVKVIRNRLDNPQSTYELGVHLEAHSKVINATANYWGAQLDASAIYRRIFDRKNRYNLAQVEFLQYLLSPEDLEYITDLSFDRERDKLITFRNGSRLGGELKGYEELTAGVYTVQDDITILPGSHLVIRDGVTLRFGDGVGLMNQGRLDALGKLQSPIQFTSVSTAARWPSRATAAYTSTTAAPQASAWVSQNEDLLDWLESSQQQQHHSSNVSSGGGFSRQRRPRQSTGAASAAGPNVRLSHTTMGKLEVQIDGVWGSVCDYNFDIDDAAVACQQMGMILNRNDWLLERFQYMQTGEFAYDPYVESTLISSGGGGVSNNAAALMTNVRCDPTLDTDITSCQAEFSLRGDFDGVCNSEVGIRCFPSSWSGVRFGMGAETGTLEHVTIQRAGMYDYAKYSLKPALQIDFNRHWLNWLTIKSNSDSGLGIMFNDVIGRHFSELAINEGKFLANERHGIELRSRGLTIRGCQMAGNRQNGLDYNPSMSLAEMDGLLSWLRTSKNANSVVTLNFPLSQPAVFNVPSSEDSYRFFVIPRSPPAGLPGESFTISTDPGHMLSIQLLSPLHWASTEQLNMSLSLNPDGSQLVWDLRVNLTSLPMVSPSYKFHLNYSSGARPLGNVILYVRSRYNNRDLKVLTKFIPAHLIGPKFDQTATNINWKLINSLVLVNNTVSRNGIGLKFRHPNHPFDSQRRVHNFRFANETTNINSNSFEGNYFSTIYVGSDDTEEQLADFRNPHEDDNANDLNYNHDSKRTQQRGQQQHATSSAEICYNLLGNKMRRNKDGIRQFSRDWRRSNNLFHWQVNETLFEANKAGGLNLMLPYFWPYDANASHSVELYNNTFIRNGNFEFSIEGHFSVITAVANRWRDNRCRQREALIGFRDMEKQLTFRHNQIDGNSCNKLIDFNIHSHADKLGSIAGYFEFNSLRNNRRLVSNATWAQWAATYSSKWPRLIERLHPTATDYALGLRGIQTFNITRNLFSGNELRFDLVVAINLNPADGLLNATENFWGSSRPADISERIFDFDDWNSYALVEFSPFLVSDSFQSASMLADRAQSDFEQLESGAGPARLGGRLTRSMTLRTRREPYLIEADLTVMPKARLTIERGVTLQFMPNVGLLILGELVAGGTREQPIQMRPLLGAGDLAPLSNYLFPSRARPNITQAGLGDALAHEHNYAFKHYAFTYPVDMGAVRLCKNEICNDGLHIYENNVEEPQLRQQVLQAADPNGWRLDGFLEVFNMSTLQWVPVCDSLFSEHAARVVCRQLGYSHLSLLKRGRRYTLEQEQVISVKSWPRSIQCEGDELNLSSCPLAAASFANHTTRCQHDSNQFVYVYCRDFPELPSTSMANNRQLNFEQLDQQSAAIASSAPTTTKRTSGAGEHLNRWGGLAFACQQSAQSSLQAQQNPTSTSSNRSRLSFVHIDRAGVHHRRRAPALQVIQCAVQLEHVSITNSAHHGLELVAPQTAVTLHQLRVRNSLGLGLNYLSLTGSSSQARHVPYLPLKQVELSEQAFGGLVDVCGPSKELRIDERVLLVFRYQSRPVDCVKIISSKLSVKHLGLRMLQFNLYNSSQLSPRPDSVRLYDGSLYDWDSRLMVEFGVEERHRLERPELRFYQTTDSTMTIRLHASGAEPKFGFIAEVVTTPVSYTVQRLVYNNVTFSEFSGNKLGAMSVATAGESTPNLILRNNRLESNCLHLFGNFTSCTSALHMELQNCPHLLISNNLFRANQAGGLLLKSFSHSAVASLEAQIERNVFESNTNTWTLALVGPKSDPYQRATVLGNYFTRNVAWHLPNVLIARMVANFSQNILVSNIGKHQIETVGFDRIPLIYQTFLANWIYNNSATYERDRSTILCNSAGQQFHKNYFVNPDNYNELSAGNWSRYDVGRPHQVARDDEIIHLVAGDGSSKELLRKNVETIPLSVIDAKRLDLHQAAVQAELNWWGFNTSSAIQNRVRDRLQHEELIRIQFAPFLDTNQTLLDGVCSGGWQRVNGVCLVYIGTRMSYSEAREFCEREHATLPLLRGHVFSGNHYEFTDFVARQHEASTSAFATSAGQQVVVLNGIGGGGLGGGLGAGSDSGNGDGNEDDQLVGLNHFDAQVERIWVRSFEVSRNACPALNDYRTRFFDCQERHAFLCEKDPQVVVTMISWWRETGGVLAVLLGLVTLLITCCCSACWLYKSRERHREKLQRKSSLHASMRSLRMGAGSQASLANGANQSHSASDNSLSEFFLHRQLYNTNGGTSSKSNSITDLSMSTQWTQPSNDETNLVRLDPGGQDETAAAAAAAAGQQLRSSKRRRPRSLSRPEYDQQTYKLPVTAAYTTSQVSLARDSLDRADSNPLSPRSSLASSTASPVRPRPRSKRSASRSASRTPSLTDSYNNFDQQQQQQQQQLQDQQVDQWSSQARQRAARKYQPERGALGSLTRSFVAPSQTPERPNFDYQQLPPPPPELSYQYSNIRFEPEPNLAIRPKRNGSATGGASSAGPASPTGSQTQLPAARQTSAHTENLYAAKPIRIGLEPSKATEADLESTSSSTFMSNRTFEESTNSYLETYQLYSDGFVGPNNQLLQLPAMNNADQISVVLTERSSVTDSIVNTRVTESQLEYRWLNQPAEPVIYQNQFDLLAAATAAAAAGGRVEPVHQRAASDMGAGLWSAPGSGSTRRLSQGNLMETSLDLDLDQAAASMSGGGGGKQFGGSQPLVSPSAAFGAATSQSVDLLQQPQQQQQQPDSKSGSRVYLETSFE